MNPHSPLHLRGKKKKKKKRDLKRRLLIRINRSHIQTILLPHAVFDLHFSPRHPDIFSIATSSASVTLYRVEQSHKPTTSSDESGSTSTASHPQIVPLQTIFVNEDHTIPVLYLSWLPQNLQIPPREGSVSKLTDAFAVSFSDGSVSLFFIGNETQSTKAQTSCYGPVRVSAPEIKLSTHGAIEVWYLAFHCPTGSPSDHAESSPQLLLFSGDDFGSLRVHELLLNNESYGGDGSPAADGDAGEFLLESSTNTDRGKYHTAGITAILPLFNDETGTFIITGSYDEYIRVIHRGTKWEALAEKRLGGGVWRLQLLDDFGQASSSEDVHDDEQKIHNYFVLASCMHGGARIVKISYSPSSNTSDEILPPTWDIQILYEFTEHKSMNYASGVFKGNQDDNDLLCISSSFYDRRVSLWKVKG